MEKRNFLWKCQYMIFLAIVISCSQSEVVKLPQNGLPNLREETNGSASQFPNEAPKPSNEVVAAPLHPRYSFVMLKVPDKYRADRIIIMTTGIFQTDEFMSEDEKYKLLDEAQVKLTQYEMAERVISRELKSYATYSQASKAREKLLQISNGDDDLDAVKAATKSARDAAAAAATAAGGKGAADAAKGAADAAKDAPAAAKGAADAAKGAAWDANEAVKDAVKK